MWIYLTCYQRERVLGERGKATILMVGICSVRQLVVLFRAACQLHPQKASINLHFDVLLVSVQRPPGTGIMWCCHAIMRYMYDIHMKNAESLP